MFLGVLTLKIPWFVKIWLDSLSVIQGRDKIVGTLESFGLDLKYMRGKAYDEAGNMAGSVNGTASLITKATLLLFMSIALHTA